MKKYFWKRKSSKNDQTAKVLWLALSLDHISAACLRGASISAVLWIPLISSETSESRAGLGFQRCVEDSRFALLTTFDRMAQTHFFLLQQQLPLHPHCREPSQSSWRAYGKTFCMTYQWQHLVY
ncbi:hypothetical protein EP47_09655 [Legionella norrlandica]|uniref:Uncharacterized protein n=1 Tax=Legionella norrlandica TaxID=1498499 RepID=A0A0A2STJ4_9GAMM|nr:hypothetical protein EP47_09655 [Legionella norrlandica]